VLARNVLRFNKVFRLENATSATKLTGLERVAAIRSEITSSTVGILTQAATKAAQTLLELLGRENDPRKVEVSIDTSKAQTLLELLGRENDPPVRLNAAKAVLLQLGPLTELGELRARIDALESMPRS